jgi:hypothetical protein
VDSIPKCNHPRCRDRLEKMVEANWLSAAIKSGGTLSGGSFIVSAGNFYPSVATAGNSQSLLPIHRGKQQREYR